MARTSKEYRKVTADYLDYLWTVLKTAINDKETYKDSPIKMVFLQNYEVAKARYNTAINAICMLGFDWNRDEEGKHSII